MKKIIIGVLIGSTIISASVFAGGVSVVPNAVPGTAFNGWYIGGGVVGLNILNQVKINNNETVQHISYAKLMLDSQTGFSVAAIKFGFGLGKKIGLGYIGGGLSYRYAPGVGGESLSPDGATASGYGDYSYSHGGAKHTLIALIRGGYFLSTNLLSYLSLGVVPTDFEFEFTDNNSQPRDYSKWFWGASVGLGFEFAVSDQITLNAAYAHTFYDASATVVRENGGTQYTTFRTVPETNSASVSVNYHFSDV